MKNLFLSVCVCAMTITYTACGGGIGKSGFESNGPITIDYKMFENAEETKKAYDAILNHLGDQAKVTDEVSISISRRAHEGTIKKTNSPDALSITLNVQSPTNPKQIRQTRYWSDNNGWQAPQSMEITVHGLPSAVESYRLEDDLFDFTANVNFDTFFQVLKDAYSKFLDADKYSYQYIKNIDITEDGYKVSIFGKLAANDQEKTEYYKANFAGKSYK
jgi:hypothetical protein